ncbi:MAG: helix-turn-helix domain-containing protein, partial [Bacteroidota bacterium]
GNVRQLKNITEQISVIEKQRDISGEALLRYLPDRETRLPVLFQDAGKQDLSERDILYKVLFDMKQDLHDLKKVVFGLMQNGQDGLDDDNRMAIQRLISQEASVPAEMSTLPSIPTTEVTHHEPIQEPEEVIEESLSLEEKEIELIRKALEKHRGKRKHAARELGISERTLYRKIKEFNLT